MTGGGAPSSVGPDGPGRPGGGVARKDEACFDSVR